MAYDVYITRAPHHFDGAQVPISEGDWRAIIENDPHLRAPDEALPSYAIWLGAGDARTHWIDWANGNLFTRNPDAALIRKLLEMAELLGAEVQGPQAERYWLDEDGQVVVEPAPDPQGIDAVEPAVGASPILDEPAPLQDAGGSRVDGAPPTPAPGERMFGPRPRNVDALPEVSSANSGGSETHADASFARRPEELLAVEGPRAAASDPGLRVGQRVRTEWGQPATVISIDCRAEMGLGKIEIRYRDGRVATTNCVSHGLQPLDD